MSPTWKSETLPPSPWEIGRWYGTLDELDSVYEIFMLETIPDAHGHSRIMWPNGTFGVRNMCQLVSNYIALPITGIDAALDK